MTKQEIKEWIEQNLLDDKGKIINGAYVAPKFKFYKNNEDKFNEIVKHTSHLQDVKITERIYHILHDLYDIPTCKTCNKKLRFHNLVDGYRDFCNKKCANLYNGKKNEISNEVKLERIRSKFPKLIINNEDIICPIHGKLTQTHNNILASKYGCKKCGFDNIGTTLTSEFAISTLNNKYPHLDFSKFNFIDVNTKSTVICSIHGEFQQSYNSINWSRNGCPKCGYEETGRKMRLDLERVKNIIEYFDNLTFPEFEFKSVHQNIKAICSIHGEFETTIDILSSSPHGCPKCSRAFTQSKAELEIIEFIKGFYKGKIIESDRKILKGKELDIYIPNKNFAIEYNGVYFHSTKIRGTETHAPKMKECNEKGIFLFQIFEDQWKHKKEIIKSMIKAKLGYSEHIYDARKCTIKSVSSFESNNFLNDNHIQGRVNADIKYGLYFHDKLISLMTFNIKNGVADLNRFVNLKYSNVRGSFNKLLNNFIKNNEVDEIVTFADLTYSYGDLYKHRFMLVKELNPGYFYVGNGLKRYHRSSFMKKDIMKKFDLSEEYINSHTEEELMNEQNNFHKIYDAGKLKFSLKLNTYE